MKVLICKTTPWMCKSPRLSPVAHARVCELQKKPVFMFLREFGGVEYIPVEAKDIHPSITFDGEFSRRRWLAFDIHNPNEVIPVEFEGSVEEWLEKYDRHLVSNEVKDRTDPIVIQAVEELEALESSAVGCGFSVVEIPDDIQWVILSKEGPNGTQQEYIAEAHRTWPANV